MSEFDPTWLIPIESVALVVLTALVCWMGLDMISKKKQDFELDQQFFTLVNKNAELTQENTVVTKKADDCGKGRAALVREYEGLSKQHSDLLKKVEEQTARTQALERELGEERARSESLAVGLRGLIVSGGLTIISENEEFNQGLAEGILDLLERYSTPSPASPEPAESPPPPPASPDSLMMFITTHDESI